MRHHQELNLEIKLLYENSVSYNVVIKTSFIGSKSIFQFNYNVSFLLFPTQPSFQLSKQAETWFNKSSIHLLPGTGISNENHSARYRLLPCELLVRKVYEAPQIIQTITIALGCPIKLATKTLFLKISHALVAAYREIKLKLRWKLLAFTVLEEAGQATRGEKASII